MIDYSSNKLRIAAGIIIVGLLASIIYYFATHGRIVIKNAGDDTLSIVLIRGDGSLVDPEEVGNGAVIRSGSYVVRNDLDGRLRVAHVAVSGWFKASEITFDNILSAKTSRVAALTYEHLIPTDDGSYVSYTDLDGYTSGFTTHPATDAFGGKSIDTALPGDITSPSTTSDGQLMGFVDTMLTKYSFKTNTSESIVDLGHSEGEHTGEAIDAPAIKRSSDINSSAIGLYQRAEEKLMIINGTKVVSQTKVKSMNEQSVVFDVNDKAWAILQSNMDSQRRDDTESEDETIAYSISIHRTGMATKTIDIGRAASVGQVAIDPSGEYVAVNKDSHLWVYRVDDGGAVMFNPFTVSTALLWNKTNLYSLSTNSGVVVFNATTRQLLPVSINTGESLSFSSVVPFGSKLYFTAFNTKQDSQLPDGYVIDLNEKDDGVTKVLAEKLPLKTDDYDVSFLGSTIYVRINYLESNTNSPTYSAKVASIKLLAGERIKNLLGEDTFKKCVVVYSE